MKNDFFDKQVREKLSEHEAPVPADAWDNIQKGRRRKSPFIFFWLLAAFIICGGTGMFIYNQKSIDIDSSNSKAAKLENTGTNQSNTTSKEKNQNDKLSNTGVAIQDKQQVSISTTDAKSSINSIRDNTSQKSIKSNGKQNNLNIVQNDEIAAVNQNKKFNKRKNRKSNSAKTNVMITQADLSSGETTQNDSAEDKESEQVIASTVADNKSDSIISKEIIKDSMQKNVAVVETTVNKKKSDKKSRPGITINISTSGFTGFGNSGRVDSLSRVTQTTMHKAEFTASEKNIRIQPGISLAISFQKSLSNKWSIEAGLGYTAIKEYIKLEGEEVNTHYNIVKRLQNGNALVNDTVATVTRGSRTIDAVNNYQFVSIPVNVHYKIVQHNKWNLSLGAGIDINLQSRYRNSIRGNLDISLASGNAKRNTSIGTGFNFQLRAARNVFKNASVFISPYAQFNPTKLYSGEMLVPRSINRAGFVVGFSYGL